MKINSKDLNQLNNFGKQITLRNTEDVSVYLLDRDQMSLASFFWKNLEREVKDVGLTCMWTWVESWIECYGKSVDYQFLLGMHKSELIGVTLIVRETQRKIPFPVKTYHVGTYGEPLKDCMQMTNSKLLIKKGFEQAFFKAIIDTVMDNFKAEELVFDHLWTKHADIIKLNPWESKRKLIIDESPMPYMDFEKIRKSDNKLSNHFGKSMAYSIRRTIKEFSDLEVDWPKTTSEAFEILDELITIYTQNMKKINRAGKFASSNYLTFQKKLIEKLFDQSKTLLIRVRSKKHGTLGCFYSLEDHGIAYSTQIGISDFDSLSLDSINKNRIKAGYTVHAIFMEECFKRGLSGYSFSTGIYPYKAYLTNAIEWEYNVSIMRGIKPMLRYWIYKMIFIMDKNRKASHLIRFLRFLANLASKLAYKNNKSS